MKKILILLLFLGLFLIVNLNSVSAVISCGSQTYPDGTGYCCDMGNGANGVWFRGDYYNSCPLGNFKYVNNANPSCSDSGVGNFSQPWCTMAKANTAASGNVVIFLGGTYNEPPGSNCEGGVGASFYPLNSGTPGNPIIFKGHPDYSRTIVRGFSSTSRPNSILRDDGNYYNRAACFGNNYITVDHMEFTQAYCGGISLVLYNSNIILQDNVIHDVVGSGGNNCAGIRVLDPLDNAIFRGNNIYNILVDFSGDSTWDPVSYEPGITLYRTTNITVEDNLVHDNGGGILFKHGIKQSVARRNKIYNTGVAFAEGCSYLSGFTSGNNDVYENIIYDEPGKSYTGDGQTWYLSDGGFSPCTTDLVNSHYFNNILFSEPTAGMLFNNPDTNFVNIYLYNNIIYDYSNPSNFDKENLAVWYPNRMINFKSDYNIYYDTFETDVIDWARTNYNLNTFTTTIRPDLENHSKQVDPMFLSTNPSSPDFLKPALGSPAIDGGVKVSGYHCNVSASIDPTQTGCKLWYGLAPDIGAYEYVSASSSPNFTFGFTDSMDKVYFEAPNDFNGTMTDTTQIFMAKNDYEATQLVVFPSSNLQNVEISVSDLQKIDGVETISLSNVEINPVSYVNLVASSRGRAGWQPDPLIPNQLLNLTNNILQPYLITVHSLSSTKAGNYTGTITIKENGVVKNTATLNVRVWNFEIPQKGKFKTTSFANWGTPDGMWSGLTLNEKWNQMMKIGDLGFKNRLPPVWGMASSFWSYGSASGYGYPTHDAGVFNATRTGILIDYMLSKGANHFFTAYTGDIYEDPNAGVIATRENQLRAYLTDYRNYLNSRGLLNMTYVYGPDEPWGTQVDHAKQTYTFIKNNVGSDVPYMQNTNQNNNAILETFRGFFDAIDINLGWYQVTNSDFYRTTYPSQFQDFWWNVNVWPDSSPNLFVDMELINARIMGPMSYAYDVQGFEYWQIFSTWSFSGYYYPIQSNELRVNWNVNWENPSRSLDGLLVYPGANRDIYSSLRYESFRDGIEDIESLYLLEGKDPDNSLLSVPIVDRNDVANFNKDPNAYKNWRIQVGETLDQLGAVSCNNADVNTDSKVNILDLALTVFNQGKSGADYNHLDIDTDGVVDGDDVSQVAGNMWGVC